MPFGILAYCGPSRTDTAVTCGIRLGKTLKQTQSSGLSALFIFMNCTTGESTNEPSGAMAAHHPKGAG